MCFITAFLHWVRLRCISQGEELFSAGRDAPFSFKIQCRKKMTFPVHEKASLSLSPPPPQGRQTCNESEEKREPVSSSESKQQALHLMNVPEKCESKIRVGFSCGRLPLSILPFLSSLFGSFRAPISSSPKNSLHPFPAALP